MRFNTYTIILALIACCNYTYAAPNRHKTTRTPAHTQRPKHNASWYKATQPIYKQYNDPGIVKALDWQADKNNFCSGAYYEPAVISADPNPLPVSELPVKITSSGPITFINAHTSKASGNVIATQPGRMAEADIAYIYYDKNNNIKRIDLLGHARLRHHNQLIAGSKIIWNIKKNTAWSNKSVYKTNTGVNNSWGTARAIQTLPHKITNLWHASYTTCNPAHPAWRISAAKLHLNKSTGMGTATAAALYFKKLPLLFFPYYRFPIDKLRHTGFLAPKFSYSKQYGPNFAWPFYWNISPNFDTTITPAWYGQNGLKLDNNFRYLTYHAVGNIDFGFLPYDIDAPSLRNHINNTFPTSPYIKTIDNLERQRWLVSTDNSITFNEYWNARIKASRVSDDYYLQTFASMTDTTITNSFPEDADLYYNSSNWHWHGAVNYTQNLYPANAPVGQVNYARLPELEGRNSYPYFWHNFSFSSDWQGVYFDQISDYPLQTNQYKTANGARWHARPGLSLPINFSSANIDPQIWWDATAYNLKRNPNFSNSTRSLPIIDVNNSAYFAANWSIAGAHFLQTFEPNIFYLYVPYQNQDNIPNFDSTSNPFSYGNLIGLNSYTGYDRLQNANQISLGFTSRTFDADSGTERTELGLGFVRYFEPRKVGLAPNDPVDDSEYSPLAAEFTAYLTSKLSVTANGAWRLSPLPGPQLAQNKSALSNAGASINYSDGNNNIFSATYTLVPNGATDLTTNLPTNYQNLMLGASVNITDHWSTMGYANYDLQRNLDISYLAGITYNSCCWELSALYSTLLTTDTTTIQKYNHRVYLQLIFKGLGSVGTNMDNKLSAYIPGYENQKDKGQL